MQTDAKEKRSNRIGSAFLCLVFLGAAAIGFKEGHGLFSLGSLLMGMVMAYAALFGRFPTHWLPWERRFNRELAEMFPQRSQEEEARIEEACERQRADAQNIKLYTIDGTPCARVPFGQEEGWEAGENSCSDCFVSLGQLHVPGCDIEECPKSHGQAISSPHHIAELEGLMASKRSTG